MQTEDTHQTNAGVLLHLPDLDVVLQSLSFGALQGSPAQVLAVCIYRAQPSLSAPRRTAYQAFALLPAHGSEELKSTGMLLDALISLIFPGQHSDGSSRPVLKGLSSTAEHRQRLADLCHYA